MGFEKRGGSLKEKSPMRSTFGTVKFSRPIDEILAESNGVDWDE